MESLGTTGPAARVATGRWASRTRSHHRRGCDESDARALLPSRMPHPPGGQSPVAAAPTPRYRAAPDRAETSVPEGLSTTPTLERSCSPKSSRGAERATGVVAEEWRQECRQEKQRYSGNPDELAESAFRGSITHDAFRHPLNSTRAGQIEVGCVGGVNKKQKPC